MNKELIKTYFEEFKHWLSGGNVQVYYKKDDEPKWLTDEECIEYEGHDNFSHIMQNSLEPEDVLIAIDDYYIKFRTAIAEGKIVEYLGYKNEWKNLTENCRKLVGIPLEELRIKPEEPKFKEGDWVRDKVNGKVVQLTEHFHPGGIELWEPKEEEYFWYKNDLVKFHETQANLGLLLESARGCSYYPAEKNFEDYCEPFIGQLPTNVKN